MTRRMKFNLSLVFWLILACVCYAAFLYGFLTTLKVNYTFWIMFVLMFTPAVVVSESAIRRYWK